MSPNLETLFFPFRLMAHMATPAEGGERERGEEEEPCRRGEGMRGESRGGDRKRKGRRKKKKNIEVDTA